MIDLVNSPRAQWAMRLVEVLPGAQAKIATALSLITLSTFVFLALLLAGRPIDHDVVGMIYGALLALAGVGAWLDNRNSARGAATDPSTPKEGS